MLNNAFAGALPLQGTEIAGQWDFLWDFLMGLSTFFFVLVVGGMIFSVIRFRHTRGHKSKYIVGNHLLEAIWIGIPTVLLVGIFVWGWILYHDMVTVPTDAYEIRVIGKQWAWQFQYDNGRVLTNEVYVPMNRPVKLIMSSQDVLHDFFIPNFRVKHDVVPGMYTTVWFEAKVPGRHQVYCTMYCGTSHSGMLAQLIVLDDQQWDDWQHGKKLGEIPVAGAKPLAAATIGHPPLQRSQASVSLVQQGRALFENKGCVSCHSTQAVSTGALTERGPTQWGLYGSHVPLTDGSNVVADENYLRESIENPAAKVVRGYAATMPTFKGLLQEPEMNALVAYIKSLKN